MISNILKSRSARRRLRLPAARRLGPKEGVDRATQRKIRSAHCKL